MTVSITTSSIHDNDNGSDSISGNSGDIDNKNNHINDKVCIS